MGNMMESLYNIRLLDELADKKTIIHNIHPFSKLMTTIVFLVITISFGKYEIGRLFPLVLYPIVIMGLGEIPILPILKRIGIAAPFVIGLGAFNPFFDVKPMIELPWIQISGGWISFISILIKCILTLLAAFILIATTGITGIGSALRILRIPKVFVMQILLTYRYIHLLIEEALCIIRAYSLRSPYEKGISFRVWGSLIGQLLIRTSERAQRVYISMGCRGFGRGYHTDYGKGIIIKDIVYLAGWTLYFLVVRYINVTMIIGSLITGGVK